VFAILDGSRSIVKVHGGCKSIPQAIGKLRGRFHDPNLKATPPLPSRLQAESSQN